MLHFVTTALGCLWSFYTCLAGEVTQSGLRSVWLLFITCSILMGM
jgi:hypothetical protein